MSEAQDKSSQTEEASERKLLKAREEGDTWSSREPGHAMAYLSLLAIVALALPYGLPLAAAQAVALLQSAGATVIEAPEDLRRVLGGMFGGVALVLGPALAILMLGGLFSVALSGPLVVSLKRLKPKPSKLNPFSGLKRVFGTGSLVEFVKNLVKLGLIAVLMLMVLRETLDRLMPGALLLPEALPGYMGGAAQKGLGYVVALMVPIVAFDIFWKRMSWLKKQRMSKKDQKDEAKESEGDPLIRARRLEIGRRRARQQIRKAVPEATLVVMNPTHYAVALRYERGRDPAPVCVAKGADLVALQIRDLALAAEVPVLESPPLARALHAVAEIDQPIPEDHWAAAAELVGYVLDLRRRVRRKLPEGTVHVDR